MPEMLGSPTSVTGMTGPNIGVVVIVVVVVSHLVLLKLSPTILFYITFPVTPSANHLFAFPMMVEVAFVTLGEIS